MAALMHLTQVRRSQVRKHKEEDISMIKQAVFKIYVVNRNNKVVAIVRTKERAMQYCKDFTGLHIEERLFNWI